MVWFDSQVGLKVFFQNEGIVSLTQYLRKLREPDRSAWPRLQKNGKRNLSKGHEQ